MRVNGGRENGSEEEAPPVRSHGHQHAARAHSHRCDGWNSHEQHEEGCRGRLPVEQQIHEETAKYVRVLMTASGEERKFKNVLND